MQKNYSTLYGNELRDLDGNLIGMLLNAVFEKDTGRVIAYQILARGGEKRYVLPTYVRSWIGDLLIVKNEDAIENLENLYRVQDGILLLRTPVVNQNSENLGEVTNYWIDTQTDTLRQIEVAKRFLFFFKKDVRFFPIKKIRKMSGEEITVEEENRNLALNLANVEN